MRPTVETSGLTPLARCHCGPAEAESAVWLSTLVMGAARIVRKQVPSSARARHAPVRGPVTSVSRDADLALSHAWLASRGHRATGVQERVFDALASRAPLLVVAPTGSGKTAAVMLPLIAELSRVPASSPGVRVLYVAPVRALVAHQAGSLRDIAEAMGGRARVGARSGDTSSHERAKQRRSPPDVMVITPESLAVLLGGDARDILATVRDVVLDEAHLLAEGKRGALLAVTLAVLDDHVRAGGRPAPRRLALSATAHPVARLAAWVAPDARAVCETAVTGPTLTIHDPRFDGAFPPAGWQWRAALPHVARRIAAGEGSTLVFVGSRARAEQWTLALRDVLPPRMPVACFHGSLSAEERRDVAVRLRDGGLRAVVATSGLEVGVDLPEVRDVLILGAPSSVTRLLQGVGRAEHRPGATPRGAVIPVGAIDLVRCAAALRCAADGAMEPLEAREGDLDVAIQGALARVALGACTRDEIADTLRRAWSLRDMTDGEVDRVIDFLATGGDALAAYPEMARVVTDGTRWMLNGPRSARRYLQGVGALVSDVSVEVVHGRYPVGHLEGRYAAMLEVGSRFILAGRQWIVTGAQGSAVMVRPDPSRQRAIPSWFGSRAAQSATLSEATEALWGELDARTAPHAAAGSVMGCVPVGESAATALAAMLDAQRRCATIPGAGRFVVEVVRDGKLRHVVAHTFAGSLANEVIARAVAARVRDAGGDGAEVSALDESVCVTTKARGRDPDLATLRAWFDPVGLREDFLRALSGSALAGAYFREVARVSQLWLPDARRGAVTPGLLFDVLTRHDPDHILLRALDRTLWSSLDGERAVATLTRRAGERWCVHTSDAPSPLAIPAVLWASRDAVAPDDPEAAMAEAARALFRAAQRGDDAADR